MFGYLAKKNVVNDHDKKEWVNYLINLMALDVFNVFTRENLSEIHDYDYIENGLLKCYKLSPDQFRLKVFTD